VIAAFGVTLTGVAGLAAAPPTATTEIYDPKLDSWTPGPLLSKGRYAEAATLLENGQILVTGGITDSGAPTSSAELYDPATNRWTLMASMHAARSWHTATLLRNNLVLVVGGLGLDGKEEVTLSSAEVFDYRSNAWTVVQNLNDARSVHASSRLADGRVITVGGYRLDAAGESIPLRTAEIFDPGTRKWTLTAPMPEPRGAVTSTALPNGDTLIVGGTDSPSPAIVYRPNSNTWKSTAVMHFAHVFHTATLLLDSRRVLVVGGSSPQHAVEVLDLSSGAWSPGPPTSDPRDHHDAVLLRSGKVLVLGGGMSLSTAEVFDPASNTWTAARSMSFARSRTTSLLLASGQVIAIGGEVTDGGGPQQSQAKPSATPGISMPLKLIGVILLSLFIRWVLATPFAMLKRRSRRKA